MPNDLEDFLRRAAARRQAGQTKSRQATSSDSPPPPQVQSPPAPARRVAPQSRDRRDEPRWETPVAEDVVLRAELVDEAPVVEPPNSTAERARAAADRANRRRPPSLARQREQAARSRPTGGASPGAPDQVAGLIELLRNPQGLRQAVLLREILDRPTDRW